MDKWVFTFPQSSEYRDRYVVITGTYGEAREKMFQAFGDKWAFQYEWKEFEPQIKQYNLKELK